MATKRKLLFLLALCTAVAAGLFVVYLKYGEPMRPPIRPNSVPQAALWIGGPDGGAWIECRAIGGQRSKRFFCSVYADVTGEILNKGAFHLQGESLDAIQLQRLMEAYTGDEIFLGDGRALVAEVPIDSTTHEQMMKRRYEDFVSEQDSHR
jgi:hypothetical protein